MATLYAYIPNRFFCFNFNISLFIKSAYLKRAISNKIVNLCKTRQHLCDKYSDF